MPSHPQPLEQIDDNEDNDGEVTSNDEYHSLDDMNDLTSTPEATIEIANVSTRGQLSS